MRSSAKSSSTENSDSVEYSGDSDTQSFCRWRNFLVECCDQTENLDDWKLADEISKYASGGLDYLSLEEYPWIPFSVTVTIWNKLEIPVLLVARFNTAAHANSREQNLLRIWRLDKVYIWRPLGKFREKSTQKPNSKILWAVLVQSHKKGFLKLTRRHSPRYYWSH